jgi:nucleoid-associated protein YgaU
MIGAMVLPVILLLLTQGCAQVRTYTVEKDRVDQELSSGNQGYMAGTPQEPGPNATPRKLTRKTYVTEVELGSYGSVPKDKVVETVVEPVAEPIAASTPQAAPQARGIQPVSMTSYTVQPNDSLGKIAQKVYGSAKKWKKIFEANSDTLKSPDRIRAGQVLKIPQE